MERNKKTLVIILVLIAVNLTAWFLFVRKQEKLLVSSPIPIVQTQPICPFINWQIIPFAAEKYFQQFTLKGKIVKISGSEIFISKDLMSPALPEIDEPQNETDQRKVIITDQTQISFQPEAMEMTGTASPGSQLKEGSLSDLKIGDIIFVISSDNVLTEKDILAVKIVKERNPAL